MYRNIPYEYNEWVAASGKIGKAYTCEHFDYAPYHVASFPTNTEEEMHERIDEYLDNKRSTNNYKSGEMLVLHSTMKTA